MRLTLGEAARAMGAPDGAVDTEVEATGALADSRKIRPGDLFFALRGELRDGHDFVADALNRGAAGVVVERIDPAASPSALQVGRRLVVEDGLDAMVRLARYVRESVDPVVVGITGSTGKTSVKDMLASIVRRRRRVVASEGSFNNELGLPLTLLRIDPDTEVVVCEMGARGPGQIKLLCELARPDIGVVTNVGVAHFELFGSQEAIAAGKTELVEALPEGGTAVLNFDDPLVLTMARKTSARVESYGLGYDAALRAEGVVFDRLGRPCFEMVHGDVRVSVKLPVSGKHQVINSLAAAAAARALGLTLDECREGLEAAELSAWRMETREVAGVVLVNDAYNANPTSMASALASCAAMASEQGRLVAVLGYMAELGEIEVAEHRRAGELAASTASRLIVVGDRAAPIAEGARAAGMAAVEQVAGVDEAVAFIGRLQPGDVLLVKGSRVAGLEAVARRVEESLAIA